MTFRKAQENLNSIIDGFIKWISPIPKSIESSYHVLGEFDGAGCKRNLIIDSVRSHTAFESQIKCEADIRVQFFPATEKRLDVGIAKVLRQGYNADSLRKIMPEMTEQDIFDVFRVFQMLCKEPSELLISRAEIIINLGLLGHVGPMDDFVNSFRPTDVESEFIDTSHEGITFEEFLHSFYELVYLKKAQSALGKTFADLLHETKIRRNMSSVQRILARVQ